MAQFLLLLKPSLCSIRNQAARATPGDRLKTGALALLGVTIWC